MFRRYISLFLAVFYFCGSYYSQVINEDLELSTPGVITMSNQINGWTVVAGDVVPPNNSCNLLGCCANLPAESAIIDCPVNTGYLDPIIGGVYPLYSVFGTAVNTGTAVNPGIMTQLLGSKIIRINSGVSNFSLEKISKSYTVTASSTLFKFAFASVFSTGHNCCDGGTFKLMVSVGGNSVVCPSFTMAGPSNACTTVTPVQFYIPITGVPWSGSPAYVFSKWNITALDLSAYIGQVVTIDFMASDCIAGGHYGYAYVDSQISPMEMNVNGNQISISAPTASAGSCGAPSFTLTAPLGMGPYNWNSSQIAIPAPMTIPNYSNQTLVVNQSGTLTLTMNPLTNCGTPITKTITLVVLPAPSSITVNNSTVCAGVTATLTASGLNTYTWSNNIISPSIAVTPSISTVYTVNGTDLNGCTNTATAGVTVFALPSLSVAGIPSVCVGTSATFTFIGASSYSLNGFACASTLYTLPQITTPYILTGSNGNCSQTTTFVLVVDQNCADVWPGDANSDGAANNLDVLELGLHIGQTGPVRAVQSNLWQSFYAASWTGTITNGKNVCHSNCNGDGIINSADTLAIFQNYNFTHQFKNATSTATAQIYFQPAQASVSVNQWVDVPIYLGDIADPIDLNGVAFTLNFENAFVQTDSIYIRYPSSYLNTGNDNLHFLKRMFLIGKLFSASTHTNNTNVSGNGMIAHLMFKTVQQVNTDTVIKLSIVSGFKSDANGTLTPLTSGTTAIVVKAGDVGLREMSLEKKIAVFPNPTKKFVTINSDLKIQRIELTDESGKTVHSTEVNDKTYQLNMQQFSEGIYFAKIFFADNNTSVHKIIYRAN